MVLRPLNETPQGVKPIKYLALLEEKKYELRNRMNLEDGALEYLLIMHPGSLLSMVDKNGVSTEN